MTKATYASAADFNLFREYILSDNRIVRRIESAGGITKYVIVGVAENAQDYMDEIGEWSEIDQGEFEHVMESIGESIVDAPPVELDAVMTAGEAQELYGLSESAVRLACQRGSIPARKSGGTWLILRADAEARWGLVDCKVYQSQGQWIVKTPAHQLVVKDRAQGFELARAYSDSSKRYYALVAEIINGVPGNEAYRE